MRKVFNKVLAGVTSVALVATLLIGINVTKPVKADDVNVQLGRWAFFRGGNAYNNEYQNGNEGKIGLVTMDDTGEVISGWKTVSPDEQEQSAKEYSTGFAMRIDGLGWTRGWKDLDPAYDTFDPWQIQAKMKNVAIIPGHTYTVSFKAHAEGRKYALITFGSTVDGYDMAPYGDAPIEGDNQLIALGTTEKTYTYKFTNWVSAESFNTTIMLGNFSASLDYGENDVSDIITSYDNDFKGTVYVNEFTITDHGLSEEFTTAPARDDVTTGSSEEKTTAAPTTAAPKTTAAPVAKQKLAKVTGVKAKNNKKKAIKVTWKKVTNATSYEIKVGSKKYTSKKTSKKIKKLKLNKTYKVRVRAKASGYTTGKWSKKVKVKIKK